MYLRNREETSIVVRKTKFSTKKTPTEYYEFLNKERRIDFIDKCYEFYMHI